MKNNPLTNKLALGLLASASLTNAGQAAITVDFVESGSNVTVTVNGTVRTTGLTSIAYGSSTVAGSPTLFSDAFSTMVDPGPTPTISDAVATNRYLGATFTIAPFAPGPGPLTFGVPAFVDLPLICISDLGDILVSDALIDNTGGPGMTYVATIPGESLTSLGISDGVTSTTSWDSGNESVSFRTGSAVPIPEPSSLALLLPALGFTAFRRRR